MSAYGRVLLAKIALFGLMLVLAAANRYWILPRLAQQGWLLGALAHTITLEQALGAAVLLAVSALGLMNPSM